MTVGVSAPRQSSVRLGSLSVISVRLCCLGPSLYVLVRPFASWLVPLRLRSLSLRLGSLSMRLDSLSVRLGSPLVRLSESLAHPGRELTGAGGASSPEAAPGATSNGARRQLPPRPADGELFLHTCVWPVTRNDGERRRQSNGGRYLGQRELLRLGVMRASAGVASM